MVIIHVTIHSPTKRGLKDTESALYLDRVGMTSYNPFPDEKGTERIYAIETQALLHTSHVTIHSPTKRGLKAPPTQETQSRHILDSKGD